MFAVGSKVVHPCHGAGTIVNIQEKSIGAKAQTYYVIDTVCGSMRLMVPVHKGDDVGLRDVGETMSLKKDLAAATIAPKDGEIEKDFRARQAQLREKIKSGSFAEVTAAVRLLYFINAKRPLGLTDRQLFDQGKEMLAGELCLASEMKVDEAKQFVADQLAAMLQEDCS